MYGFGLRPQHTHTHTQHNQNWISLEPLSMFGFRYLSFTMNDFDMCALFFLLFLLSLAFMCELLLAYCFCWLASFNDINTQSNVLRGEYHVQLSWEMGGLRVDVCILLAANVRDCGIRFVVFCRLWNVCMWLSSIHLHQFKCHPWTKINLRRHRSTPLYINTTKTMPFPCSIFICGASHLCIFHLENESSARLLHSKRKLVFPMFKLSHLVDSLNDDAMALMEF